MNPLRILVQALGALRRNKVRTGLTMLGIAIGIIAVIAMGALGRGASTMIQTQISAAGRNILLVLPESISSRGLAFGMGTSTTLTPDDAAAVAKEVPSVRLVAPMIRARTQLVYENRNWVPLAILGTSAEFLEIREWPTGEGTPLSPEDVANGARVCVLGRTVARNLFEGLSPIGESIRIKNMPFRVVGVLAPKGVNPMGFDQDDIILTPWTTTRALLQGTTFGNIDQMLISAVSPAGMDEAARDIRTLLRERHRLPDEVPDDFFVITMKEMAAVLTRTSRLMSTLIAAVASISLLVGGIGIMNVMLVSVVQRTHEIGLRMAVGARRRDILAQFLAEALVLSGVAGLIGALSGIAAATAISSTLHWPTLVSPGAVSAGFAVSAAVGIVFGFYPAFRAARLDPIEALRYE